MKKIPNEISNKFNYEGLRSVAAIVMQLKEVQADKVMNMLDIEEVQAICFIISELGQISQSFIDVSAKEFVVRLRQSTRIGDMKTVENLISNLSPERKESILKGINRTIWKDIENLDKENLFEFLNKERPTVVALILSHLSSDLVVEFITKIEEERALDIVLALSNVENIDNEILEQVEDSLKDGLTKIQSSFSRRVLIELFNNLSVKKEQYLTGRINVINPELSNFIKNHIFKFENLEGLREKDMQTLLNAINKEDLKFAMQKAPKKIFDMIFKNMSERAARVIKDDIQMSAGSVTEEEILTARSSIASVARNLIKNGEIKIS
ncbi:hypothetical protein GUI12_01350 [Anaplasmataceae bacterium AB001_6]|nr:hypothetical protein GUI12_01350 [Anaplasmataceae bacterium AB001_6]